MFIDCPASAIQYPAFHTARSQFYNMAMLLPEIYKALSSIYTNYFTVRENNTIK